MISAHLIWFIVIVAISMVILSVLTTLTSWHFYNSWQNKRLKTRESDLNALAERLSKRSVGLLQREQAVRDHEQLLKHEVHDVAIRAKAAYDQARTEEDDDSTEVMIFDFEKELH